MELAPSLLTHQTSSRLIFQVMCQVYCFLPSIPHGNIACDYKLLHRLRNEALFNDVQRSIWLGDN